MFSKSLTLQKLLVNLNLRFLNNDFNHNEKANNQKKKQPGVGMKLFIEQGLAVCCYLGQLDQIGVAV